MQRCVRARQHYNNYIKTKDYRDNSKKTFYCADSIEFGLRL